MLPQGMFSVAVATVLFPSLARLAARGDTDGFRDTVALGLRQIAFLLIPASVALRRARRADRAPPLPARRVHARRRRPSSRPRSPRSRSGSPSTAAMLMLNRAFFSLQRHWVPTVVALGNLGAERRARRRLLPRSGRGGSRSRPPSSTSPAPSRSSSCSAGGSGGSSLRETPTPSLRIVVASASRSGSSPTASGAALDDALGRSFVGADRRRRRRARRRRGAYLVFCRLLRVRELEALLSLRTRRRRPAR